jgi:uncharacterized RDD family membrane protein YckC
MAHAFVTPRDPTRVLGRRLAAFLIDAALLAVIGSILASMVQHASFYGAPSGACATETAGTGLTCYQLGHHLYIWDGNALFRSEAFTAAVGFLNWVVLQAITGASFGKLLFGLSVVDAQGLKAGSSRMLGRWILLLVDAGCVLVGLITVLATNPHRRVGDLVCGTYVVSRLSVGRPIGAFRYAAPVYSEAAPDGPGPASLKAPPPQWVSQAPPPTPATPKATRSAPKPASDSPSPTATLTGDAATHWSKPPPPRSAKSGKPKPKKSSGPPSQQRWSPAAVTPPREPDGIVDDD